MEEDDLFNDDDPLNGELLTQDVRQAIAAILPSEDALDRPDFDLVEYINELFPNEQSLSNIDDVITLDRARIKRIDNEIRSLIHNQSETAEIGKASLEDAQKAILHLFAQIKDIKTKAEKSEEIVKEITRDIKQLDVAKRNLTLSITTLNHFFILVEGVENLESLMANSKVQDYAEMSSTLQRVINVIDHFASFTHIEHVAELTSRAKKIRGELPVRVKREFEETFINPFGKLDAQHGGDLCKMIDVLDEKLKLDLIKQFLKQQLNEYTYLFSESDENSWLDKIDRRYSWIKKTLGNFEEKFNKIFPVHWDMSERLAVEFCELTKRELANITAKRKLEIDNKLLMFAIQRTTKFEQLLTEQFLGRSVPKPKNQPEISDEDWKPFLGMISQCFDAHFDIYTNFTDAALADLLSKFAEDVKANGFPRMISSSSNDNHNSGSSNVNNNLHNSSADLFIFYKNCMTQCLQLFTNSSLLCKLAATFQKYLREYSNRILSSNLPRLINNHTNASYLSNSSSSSSSSANSSAASSGGSSFSASSSAAAAYSFGAATSLIQNFQIQNILKDGVQNTIGNVSSGLSSNLLLSGSGNTDATKKLNETEICRVCSILCTAEYCLDTTQQLEDKLREKVVSASAGNMATSTATSNQAAGKLVDPKQQEINARKINFNNEKEIFANVVSNCIQLLVQDLENSCEPALTAMSKISWHNFSSVGDQSSYVTAIVNHMKTFVPLVRDNLANSRKYFTQFCSKFANNLISKFMHNIFRCKFVTQSGIEQLLLDTHSLKTALLDMPTINAAVARKAPATYTKMVVKEMTRAELLLKSVMAPGEPALAFVENYLRLAPDNHDLEQFKMILEMKGFKKNEFNNYIEIFKSKLASVAASAAAVAAAQNQN